jgi:hypothetical protein
MMRKAQDVREMTPHIIVDKVMLLSIPRSSGIFTLVVLWLKALRTNERASFREWFSDPSVKKPVAFAAMPEAMLQFAEQAGIQLLSRWQKVEYFASFSEDGGSNTELASLFFALTVRYGPTPTLKACNDWHYFPRSLKLDEIQGEYELPANILNVLQGCLPEKYNVVQSVIIWRVVVNPSEKAALKNFTEGELAHLWHLLRLDDSLTGE